MTKSQIKSAWKTVVSETHKRAKLGKRLQNKSISLLGDLLLSAQVLLRKIEIGEDALFNSVIYKKVMSFYCAEMKKYV